MRELEREWEGVAAAEARALVLVEAVVVGRGEPKSCGGVVFCLVGRVGG